MSADVDRQCMKVYVLGYKQRNATEEENLNIIIRV